MTSLNTVTLGSADHAAVASASKMLLARYRGFVTYSDIQQECYLWLLTHQDKVTHWRETLDTRHSERTIIKALRNAGERFCRSEKAHFEGYSPDDEFFYSLPWVADLLQLSFDPEYMIPNGIELSQPTSGKPASEGGNLVAMVADVSRAFAGLPAPDRDLLRRVYEGDDNHVRDMFAELSLEWDCSYSAAQSRVRRVVGRLRAALGGASPYGQDRT